MGQGTTYSLVIAVGERCYWPGAHPDQVEKWRRAWDRNALGSALRCPAMTHGGRCRTRVESTGLAADRFINLLPPSPTCGDWDAAWATRVAAFVLDEAKRCRWSLAFLGRKVTDAFCTRFGVEVELCDVFQLDGVKCVALPHPSGRSRYTNQRDAKDRVRSAVDKFLGKVTA